MTDILRFFDMSKKIYLINFGHVLFSSTTKPELLRRACVPPARLYTNTEPEHFWPKYPGHILIYNIKMSISIP